MYEREGERWYIKTVEFHSWSSRGHCLRAIANSEIEMKIKVYSSRGYQSLDAATDDSHIGTAFHRHRYLLIAGRQQHCTCHADVSLSLFTVCLLLLTRAKNSSSSSFGHIYHIGKNSEYYIYLNTRNI